MVATTVPQVLDVSCKEKESADGRWLDLYRVGGWSCFILAAMIVFAIAAYFIWPYTPGFTSLEAILTTLHENRVSGLMSLDLVMVLMSPLTIIPSLALYVALKRVNESYALIALALGLTGIVLCFVDRPLVEMVALSDLYAAATTDAARQQILAAGEAFHVMFNGTAWVLWNFFLCLSYMINEVLMLRGGGFRKSTAYLGLVLSVSGLGFWLPGIGTRLSLLGTAGGVAWYVLMGTDLLRLAGGAKASQA
jgi:hypothetical protein